MKKAWIIGLGLLLLALFLLAACGGEDAAEPSDDAEKSRPYVIGISPLTTQLEYYVGYIEGIQKAAREAGVEVAVVDSQWDSAKQESDIRAFVEDGVDAVICSPVDPETIGGVLREAEAAGVAVVVEMTYVEGVEPLVATDQYAGGQLVGRYAGEWMSAHREDILRWRYSTSRISRTSMTESGASPTGSRPHAPVRKLWPPWMRRPRWRRRAPPR